MPTLLFCLFFGASASISFAQEAQESAETCHLHRLTGEIDIQDANLRLILAKGSMSQVSIVIPIDIQSQAAPYINQSVLLEGVFDQKRVDLQTELKAIKSITSSVSDPLNQNEGNTLKWLGEAPCP